ncbi:TPA: AzlD domain-containing protein [Providencia rettgeri]|uniref:AzlD domain-containing protein n=1 Tax=Providencia TaxID=586 RepID=UPI001B392B47|nr:MULTISPECIES: AzlD domain-containing protein [Providencia]EMB5785377.1 AzlD domain-containing protein [Providencia rettgeri]MBQ0366896.1 AzlD domain-containing protein [Providencia rettgeri]MDK7745946.1 AzlD domain-containing protein [Providencia rettgeri]MDK7758392.1 AzlD domain-containing protein [Providencia rettgeri]HBC7430551.1 AzlD domain-containing protein [Providencia rettgeri]
MTNNPWLIISGILLLAVGTYLMRASGALLRGRVVLSENNKMLFSAAAIVILFSVAVTSTLFSGDEISDWPKIVGVLVAGVLTWFKKPFIIIVLSAAIVTALLRLF